MQKFTSLLRPYRLKVTFLFILIAHLMCNSAWSQLPTAPQVASQIRVGWNIGNTLEAPCGETCWGNPMVSQTLINSVKAAGFNAIRIPCAWDSHQTNGVIHSSWLARVKQVVDYCVNNNMYAILNIHWDGGWLEEHPLYSHQNAVNAKQWNYWTQIANYFKNYNERLLFAGTNEVRANYNDPTTEHINVQQSYLQTFVDAVRATGGNNSTRTLVVQTYNTNAWHGINHFWLPSDPTPNRLMVEIHNYDPFDFTLNPSGSCLYWGSPYPSQSGCSWAQEAYIDDYYAKVKAEWVDKGVPVIVGEYAANLRTSLSGTQLTNHIASRQYWNYYVTKAAYQRGIKSFYWDNGVRENGGKLFDRYTGAITDQGVVDAIMSAVGTTPPPPSGDYTMFKNRATNLQIDGMYRSTNGSNVGQYATSGSTAQQWMIETVGSYVKLRNRATNLYLDGMGRTANGSAAGQYSNGGSYNQQWTIETVGSYVKLRNRATGLYLDGMGRTGNGSDLGQWSSSSSNNQQWTLTNVTSSARTSDPVEEFSVEEHGRDARVFPNPFTSGINVSILDPKKVKSIIMLDLTGTQVEVIDHNNVKTDQTMGAFLDPGFYVVQINTFGNRQSFKVIKK